MTKILIALSFLLIISYSVADFRQETKSQELDINPKQVTEANFKIIKSGTLEVTGNILNASLLLHLPQKGIELFNVEAENFEFINDEYGNRLILLTWKNPKSKINYKVETFVKSEAFFTEDKSLINTKEFTNENSQMTFTPAFREIAFPFENNLEKVAKLTTLVNDRIEYDLSLVGQLKSSDWVYDNQRGVCVEYANLLGSLLRISDISTRYIVGYAYSNVQNKLIGHTWVEVLADDGTWIPFDPTWLQGGYLDATHIITAIREDANQTEKISYFGNGNIDWKINEDEIEIINLTLENVTSVTLESETFPINGYGYVKANLNTRGCTIVDINLSSCISENGKMLNILDDRRSIWTCNQEEIYWFFDIDQSLNERSKYTCPTIAYDQTGLEEIINISIEKIKNIEDITINGPSSVKINQEFSLEAPDLSEFIFYSPDFGKNENSIWNLKIDKPGNYKFYLYSNNALAEKTISVNKEKEFDISASTQKNTTSGGTFLVNVIVENIMDKSNSGKLKIFYEGKIQEREITFNPNESKNIIFNLTASEIGNKKIEAFIESDSIEGYSTSIYVYELEEIVWWQKLINDIISFFTSFF